MNGLKNREERAKALLLALGNLDEEDVRLAEPGRTVRWARGWGQAAAAAALLLVIGSAAAAALFTLPMDDGSTSGAEGSGMTSGMTSGAGSGESAAGGESMDGGSVPGGYTVRLLDEAALEAGETDPDALTGTSAVLTADGDTGALDGDPVALPEGMPVSDGLIYAPERQVFIAGSGGRYRLYPVCPEDWPDIQPGAEVSWTEAMALLKGD